MPKQTSTSRTKRCSGPYPQPPRTRSQTSASTMNHPTRTAASTAAPHGRYHTSTWPQTMHSPHAMPSHLTGYPHPQQTMTTQPERAIPPSPTTPVTPGHGGVQGSNNPSAPWTTRDDDILLQARAQSHGWNQIQRDHFPNKTPNACRKRYERLTKRRGSDWNDERMDRVTHRYMQMREQTWRPLADAVGEDWQDVEKLVSKKGPPHHHSACHSRPHHIMASPNHNSTSRVCLLRYIRSVPC